MNELIKDDLCAFIIIYKKPLVAIEHLRILAAQTLTPKRVLIVDNGNNAAIYSEAVKIFSGADVLYKSIGYNSGPAGAACTALEILCESEYTLAYWGDEDDPPKENDCIERLAGAMREINCAVIGAAGNRYDRVKCMYCRPSNSELSSNSLLAVDSIGGNQSRLMNLDFIRKSGLLPNATLFFGHEELEYDLRIKDAGGDIFCDAKMHLGRRVMENRMAVPRYSFGLTRPLWREYYSARNLAYICSKTAGRMSLFQLIARQTIGSLYKTIKKRDTSYVRLIFLAHFDFLRGRMGVSGRHM